MFRRKGSFEKSARLLILHSIKYSKPNNHTKFVYEAYSRASEWNDCMPYRCLFMRYFYSHEVSGSYESSVGIVTRQRVCFPLGPKDVARYSLQTGPHGLLSMENGMVEVGMERVLPRQYS
jgi:hypothetical protein